MTTRERCLNILHYKDVDRLPAVHFGYWGELLIEWAEQGHISMEMAKGAVHDGSPIQRELDKIIGWDCTWHNCVYPKLGLSPTFEKKILETLPDGSQRVQTAKGVIEKSGSWFSHGEERLGQGRDNIREYLKKNPEFCEQIKREIEEVIEEEKRTKLI